MAAELEGVALRQASETDLTAICALEKHCFTQDGFSARQLRYLLCRAKSAVWVAECHAQIVGYCILLIPELPRPARLYSLAVAPEFRGRGIAAALINGVLEHASLCGYSRVRLEVSELNHSARKLYEGLGFVMMASLPGYYENGVNGLRMEYLLSANNERSVAAGHRAEKC